MLNEQLELRDIAALQRLSQALGQFSAGTRDSLLSIDAELGRTLSWIGERVQHWQRQVERARQQVMQAQAALRRCESSGTRDQPPNCGAEEAALRGAQARLRECQEALGVAQKWRSQIEQAVDGYRREEQRLKRLGDDHTEKARARLQQLTIKYEAVHVGERLRADLGAPHPLSIQEIAAIEARDQQELQLYTGAVRLMLVAGIRPEVWKTLNADAKLEALRQAEATLARAQGRTAERIVAERMDANICGYYDGEALHVNANALKNKRASETLGTVVHEGHHAYQRYAVEHPGFHPDQAQVEAWRDNFQNYRNPQMYGYRRYREQPVEADAFAYASRVSSMLYERES